MSSTAMTLVLVVTLGTFAWSASRRWRLILVTRPDPRITLDRDSLAKRFANVLVIAGLQKKMPANERYRLEGIAHIAIFAAFNVLLLNSVLLWGRGYDVSFDFWGLRGDAPVAALLDRQGADRSALCPRGGRLRLRPHRPQAPAHDLGSRRSDHPGNHHHHDAG